MRAHAKFHLGILRATSIPSKNENTQLSRTCSHSTKSTFRLNYVKSSFALLETFDGYQCSSAANRLKDAFESLKTCSLKLKSEIHYFARKTSCDAPPAPCHRSARNIDRISSIEISCVHDASLETFPSFQATVISLPSRNRIGSR